jgi:hypothetical protein
MIFSENRFPLFRIMLEFATGPAMTPPTDILPLPAGCSIFDVNSVL